MYILCADGDAGAASAHTALLQRAGHVAEQSVGRKAIEEALRRATFDVVILGHTLTKEDRHHLPYAIKKSNPATRVVVLHASGHHPKVDVVLDSRRGEAAIFQAIADVLCEPVEN
jgi:DNA-binding NtrC family response regulator